MKSLKTFFYYFAIILIVILCVYLFFYIRSESYQCMKSPLTYGLSKYSSTGGELSCICSAPMSKDSILVTKDNISYMSNNLLVTPLNSG